MAKIMAVNAGSSSIKFQLLEMPAEEVIASGVMERIGLANGIFTLKYDGKKEETNPVLPTHAEGVELLLSTLLEKGIVASLDEIAGVGHRVVQGGEYFKDSSLVDETVVEKIAELADLAPLHNPAHIIGIKAFQKALPNVPQVVVFDTVFHQTMPEEAYMYATPYEWYEKYGIRKYGAHGTSHKYVSERCAELMGKPLEDTKIIVCHLGNGASISAVDGGKCKDTSMGLTPLAGVPMGTRSGDIDAAVVEYICDKTGKDVHEVLNILNKKSGVAGISEVSSDFRDLDAAKAKGDYKAELALNMFIYGVKKYIGAYSAAMGGIDVLVFTAGIGENNAKMRADICDGLEYLGVEIDKEENAIRKPGLHDVTAKGSKVKVLVIPTNEELVIARDTKALVFGK